MNPFPHQKVSVVSFTIPFIEGCETPEELISYTARVSNPGNQNNKETSEKLVGYLMRNAHWSPFEMVDVTMDLWMTRDIGRQILRHRSFVFQEFSQRYADPTKMEFAQREARLQDTKNRQNSVEIDDNDLQALFNQRQQEVCFAAIEAYRWALENGIAKEQARVFLPEGLTMSHMYMKGSVRSWIHYLQLRLGNGTQKEHRELAKMIAAELQTVLPSIIKSTQGEEWNT